MNIKQRLQEIAEDLQVIANDHPAKWPPVNLEIEAWPNGSIVCKQLGDGSAETIAPNCSFGSQNFRVRNVSQYATDDHVLAERIFNWFDDDSAGAEAAGELFRLILPRLTGCRPADRLTKANNSKSETILTPEIAKRILADLGRPEIPDGRNQNHVTNALQDCADGIPSMAAAKLQTGETIEPIDFFSVDPVAQVRNDSRYRFARNSAGGQTVYFIGEGQRPEYWKGQDSQATEFRYCANCKLWFAGPAKIDTKNTFCGEGCQNEFFINAKDTEPGTAAATLRPAYTIDNRPANPFTQIAEDHKANHEKRFGAIETPANNDAEGVAKCSNCGKSFLALDGFQWTKGGEDARPICSVDCLASAAGLLPNE